MNDARFALLGAIALCFVADPAVGQAAQSPAKPVVPVAAPPSGQLSDAETKAWNACTGMLREAMAKDAACARLRKDHPDAKPWSTPPGAMKPDATGPDHPKPDPDKSPR